MSRFFSDKYAALTPYTPGEQPKDMRYVKLNTNESPFPPCEAVIKAAAESAGALQLYPDPDCTPLAKAIAKRYGVGYENVIVNNGSDETLNFAFMAFCDKDHPAVFPDITYGFYPVFAMLNGVPYTEIPLKDDFTVDVDAFCGVNKTVFIANPNAPTGVALPLSAIARIAESNPDNVVVIDEAYVDFGADSAVKLTEKYENLLVVQTFSKSRSMAGARLGYGIGSAGLVADLQTVKYSTNPYNINRMTIAAGLASLENDGFSMANCRMIEENRAFTVRELKKLGFTVLPSLANFIFIRSDRIDGKSLYLRMKEKGVLIRHFDKERICDFNRVSIGSREQMEVFLDTLRTILEETV